MNTLDFTAAHKRKLETNALANVSYIFEHAPGDLALPLYDSKVAAGYPSPAADHVKKRLKADDYLVKNETATFYVQVEGDSMKDAGIFHGDILVVDRSLEAHIGSIVVAEIEGKFTVKFLGHNELIPANADFETIKFKDGETVLLAGVVTGSMRKFV
ncbi:MAG: LexA family protein [Methylophilaceae bacterium]|nr:translesion error-prone DNA polymerase V autoproteolytic subunit [Methyloradius sp.]